MDLFLQLTLAGLAIGSIYACVALAVVMIYQATDHFNFAQGEMAMFSTFVAALPCFTGCWFTSTSHSKRPNVFSTS